MFKTLISLSKGLYETTQAVIGTARLVLDGQCVPLADLPHAAILTHDADEFSHHPTPFDTGANESCAAASWLVHLSAKNGRWHGVAWSLLRNEQLGHGLIKKLQVRGEKRVPEMAGASPREFRAEFGDGPLVDLIIGISQLREAGLVAVATVEDEDFLVPTDALLERSMRNPPLAFYS